MPPARAARERSPSANVAREPRRTPPASRRQGAFAARIRLSPAHNSRARHATARRAIRARRRTARLSARRREPRAPVRRPRALPDRRRALHDPCRRARRTGAFAARRTRAQPRRRARSRAPRAMRAARPHAARCMFSERLLVTSEPRRSPNRPPMPAISPVSSFLWVAPTTSVARTGAPAGGRPEASCNRYAPAGGRAPSIASL